MSYIEAVSKEATVMKIYSVFESGRLLSVIYFPGILENRLDLIENQHEIQASIMHLPAGTEVKAHKHLDQARETNRTQEVWIVQDGKAKISIFDIDDRLICHQEVTSGCLVILLDGGHGIDTVTSNLVLVEIKNGPYRGSHADKLSI